MTTVFKTKMTSKGQITIPKRMREYLDLKPGDLFWVYTEEDILVFKKIEIPDPEEMKELASKSKERSEDYLRNLRLVVKEDIEWAKEEHNKREIENNKH